MIKFLSEKFNSENIEIMDKIHHFYFGKTDGTLVLRSNVEKATVCVKF